MEKKTTHVRVTGLVQGVSFRYYTKKKADQLQLSGWVRNCTDGSVEALISGPENVVDQMISWFSEGSPYSVVEQVSAEPSDIACSEDTFKITY